MQDFDAIGGVNISFDVPNNPMQDYEGAIPNHTGLPNSEANSPDRHYKISQVMAKSVSEWHFIAKKHVLHAPKGFLTNKWKQTSFMILI